MKLGIKRKILIMNIAVIILSISGMCVVTVYELYTRITNNSIDMLRKESYSSQAFVMNYLQNENKFRVKKVLNEMGPFIATYLSGKSKMRVQIYNNDFSIMGDSENDPYIVKDEDVVSAINGKKAYIIRNFKGKDYVLFSSPIYYNDTKLGCIRFVYNLEKENNIVFKTILSMIFFAIISMLSSIIMSNSFSNKIVDPIVKLKDIASEVSHGKFIKDFHIDSNDEIEDLSKSFSTMSNNIENMILKLKDEKETQKRFLDNITHEFKTPLAAIMGYSDLLSRVEDRKNIEECTKYIKKSSDRLLNLVEQLLELSLLNKNQLHLKKEPVDIKSVVENSMMLLKPRMIKFGIKVVLKMDSKVINIDREKTEQVILNILDNAIKYSECTKIIITMDYTEESVRIFIDDNGQGIPKKDLNSIFEHFYTAHKTLQNKHGGSGLGLAICKEIMEKQLGNIKIESLNGTKVILEFKDI